MPLFFPEVKFIRWNRPDFRDWNTKSDAEMPAFCDLAERKPYSKLMYPVAGAGFRIKALRDRFEDLIKGTGEDVVMPRFVYSWRTFHVVEISRFCLGWRSVDGGVG